MNIYKYVWSVVFVYVFVYVSVCILQYTIFHIYVL